jgi:hypothetical protein
MSWGLLNNNICKNNYRIFGSCIYSIRSEGAFGERRIREAEFHSQMLTRFICIVSSEELK